MRPQIGTMIHYIPLNAFGLPAEPKPALVMGVHEVPGKPLNLHLAIFEEFGSETRMSYSRGIPPASTTVTGSGWAWPEWPVTRAEADITELRRMASAFDPLIDITKERPKDDDHERKAQEGSVILLALGAILVAGILSTALGL